MGSASSAPARLTYQQPQFNIIHFEQPGDGNLYGPTLRKLFPQTFYDQGHLSNEEITKLATDVFLKAQATAASSR